MGRSLAVFLNSARMNQFSVKVTIHKEVTTLRQIMSIPPDRNANLFKHNGSTRDPCEREENGGFDATRNRGNWIGVYVCVDHPRTADIHRYHGKDGKEVPDPWGEFRIV